MARSATGGKKTCETHLLILIKMVYFQNLGLKLGRMSISPIQISSVA